MVTCGLDHYSRPHDTDIGQYDHPHLKKRMMPLHGRIATERARLLHYRVDDETQHVVCEGVRQASVFGVTLELRRRISLPLFEAKLTIDDTVINRGFRPSNHAHMYHMNFGYPFPDETLTVDGLPDPLDSELKAERPTPYEAYGEKVNVVDSRISPHDLPVVLRSPKGGIEIAFSYTQ